MGLRKCKAVRWKDLDAAFDPAHRSATFVSVASGPHKLLFGASRVKRLRGYPAGVSLSAIRMGSTVQGGFALHDASPQERVGRPAGQAFSHLGVPRRGPLQLVFP